LEVRRFDLRREIGHILGNAGRDQLTVAIGGDGQHLGVRWCRRSRAGRLGYPGFLHSVSPSGLVHRLGVGDRLLCCRGLGANILQMIAERLWCGGFWWSWWRCFGRGYSGCRLSGPGCRAFRRSILADMPQDSDGVRRIVSQCRVYNLKRARTDLVADIDRNIGRGKAPLSCQDVLEAIGQKIAILNWYVMP
jgi:hypothetical protein